MAVGQKRGVMHAARAPPCVAAPGDLGGLAVRRHLDAGGDAVETHDEQPVARRYWLADGHAEGWSQWHAPVHLAGLWVQRLHRVAMPNDQLPKTAEGVDDRRAIPRLPPRERAPQFLARAFVERHTRGACAAHHTDQTVAIH